MIQFLGICTLACCSAALTTLLYNYFHQEETEVLFFYGYEPMCGNHLSKEARITTVINDCFMCKVNKIIGWLNATKKTLDVCMYSFSHELLANAVIDAHKRGVIVRVILNEDNVKTTWKMGNVGISKRVKKNQHDKKLMHHKFIIIDKKKVISGSLNWNLQSVRSNWENAFITNNCELVTSFEQEFQRLWKQFN